MRRARKWLMVGRLVAMMVLSPAALASEVAADAPANEAPTSVTYTPMVVEPFAPAPRPASEWTTIEKLPALRPTSPTEPADVLVYGDNDERPFASAKHRFMGNSGISSVVGLIGATYTYSPVELFQVELGTGFGFSGFQFSLMPKLSLGDDHHRAVFGVGPSVGITRDSNPAYTYVAYWLNAEVGYEYRSAGGFSFLIAGGFFHGIGGQYRDECVIDCEGDTHGWPEPTTSLPFLPQGRVAFGRWF
jgi:hypothetical protein